MAVQILLLSLMSTNLLIVGYDKDKRPWVGPNALKQVDILIFLIAVMHIALCLLAVFLTKLRISLWHWRLSRRQTTTSM